MSYGEEITLTRGSLTVLRGNRVWNRPFMFNPPNISDAHAITWVEHKVPGASHPIIQFGSGGARTINFKLYLDGDRGRYGRSSTLIDGLSVHNEINFYQSLTFPADYETMDWKQVAPYVVLFNFGVMYSGVPCIVKSAPVEVLYFTPKLEPVRANVNISLEEIVSKTQSADSILNWGWSGRR